MKLSTRKLSAKKLKNDHILVALQNLSPFQAIAESSRIFIEPRLVPNIYFLLEMAKK